MKNHHKPPLDLTRPYHSITLRNPHMSVILTQPWTPMGPRVKLLASSQRRLDQGQHGLKEWPGGCRGGRYWHPSYQTAGELLQVIVCYSCIWVAV